MMALDPPPLPPEFPVPPPESPPSVYPMPPVAVARIVGAACPPCPTVTATVRDEDDGVIRPTSLVADPPLNAWYQPPAPPPPMMVNWAVRFAGMVTGGVTTPGVVVLTSEVPAAAAGLEKLSKTIGAVHAAPTAAPSIPPRLPSSRRLIPDGSLVNSGLVSAVSSAISASFWQSVRSSDHI